MPEKETDRMHVRDNLKMASDAFNKSRKNPQWRLIEKQLENVLTHWRSRIGMEKKQVSISPSAETYRYDNPVLKISMVTIV